MRPLLPYFIAIAAVAAGFAGCKNSALESRMKTGHAFPESDRAARDAGLANEDIAAGRKLYATKCARCHKLYDPAGYDATEWHSWMTKMSKKARLKAGQEQLLSRYLEAFRTSPTDGAPIQP